MRNKARLLSGCGHALLLGGLLLTMPFAAAGADDVAHVPLKTMNQAEYEAYREQLQKQVKQAEVPEQGKVVTETEAAKEQGKTEDSGYGRGYRSRAERGGRAGGGYRSGAMSRGGGRGR
jgi:hypothetical protein